MENPGTANFADTETGAVSANEAGTEGGTTAAAGVNGSRARLPYSLDPARTPVMGSWRGGTQQPAVLRSAWYRLPPRDERGPAARRLRGRTLRPRRGHRAVGHDDKRQ